MALIPCKKLALRWDANLESNLFNKLCDELVGEILVRLPTTVAVRFQVVCKRWYSLISSPYFITRFRHLRHQHIQPTSLVFRFAYSCDFTCGSGCHHCQHSHFQIISNSNSSNSLLSKVYGESAFRLSYLPCSPIDLQALRLEGSFADLILCSCITPTNTNTYETNYYVSNLLTRKWIALPPVAYDVNEYVSIGFVCVPSPVAVDTKFMVVRLCSSRYEFTPRSWFKAQVFSSENWQWRTLVVSSPLTLEQHIGGTPLVAYRGMLHWLNADCILVYDPLNTPERFSRVIHLPIQISPSNIYRSNCFGVSRGCLRVTGLSGEDTVNRDPVLDVWELEDYDSGLWNLVHKVHLKNLIHHGFLESLENELRHCLLVISHHPENGDVIYLRLHTGVVLVNMKSKIIERFYPMDDVVLSVRKAAMAPRYGKKVKLEEGETSDKAEALSRRIDKLSRLYELSKFAQPDCVRRSVRSEYTAIQDFINERSYDIGNAESDRFKKILGDVEGLFQNVTWPREQVADAETMLELTNTLVASVQSHLKGSVSPSQFVSCFLKDYGRRRAGKLCKNARQMLPWKEIGCVVSPVFMDGSGCKTMFGPMDNKVKLERVDCKIKPEPLNYIKEIKERTRWAPYARPTKVVDSTPEWKSNTDKNVSAMFDTIEKNKSIKLENLILNRTSYAQTIENIFALSFLVKDGRVAISVAETGSHFVSPKGADGACTVLPTNMAYKNFIFRFDYNDWKVAATEAATESASCCEGAVLF
nr:non-structural maintenance of chromosomes element 4 homolog A-like [Ipomoea batatas]